MIIPESYEQFPEGTYGYVYQTTHLPTGKKYVGKKALIYNQKKKIGKREAALWEGKGRPPIYKRIQKESDWKTYYGSHPLIKEEIKNGNQADFERIILQLAYSKKELTYLENKALFSLAVLEREEYLNDNIEGRYFKKDFGL
tara:strand:+ start:14 stop:439 length:426 start_codon:yes stop_codon:yes gene_type:complete